MPLYYFHLGVGSRLLRDDEGVELPDRATAREEASAVIRELTPSMAGHGSGRGASWFLRVADSGGAFLHLAFGRPALEIVTDQTTADIELVALNGPESPATPAAPIPSALLSVIMGMLERRRQTAKLLEENRRLRKALASVFAAREHTRAQSSRLVESARKIVWGGEPQRNRPAARKPVG